MEEYYLKNPNCDDWIFLGTKCQGSNTNWSCCTSSSPCKEDEGDCDTDSDCESGLVCGTDNCPSGFPSSAYDCCYKPSGLLLKITIDNLRATIGEANVG